MKLYVVELAEDGDQVVERVIAELRETESGSVWTLPALPFNPDAVYRIRVDLEGKPTANVPISTEIRPE